jgi:hypothetical protein
MRTASIAVMLEAARTSETSVIIDLRTRQYIPEDLNSSLRVHKSSLLVYNLSSLKNTKFCKNPFIAQKLLAYEIQTERRTHE